MSGPEHPGEVGHIVEGHAGYHTVKCAPRADPQSRSRVEAPVVDAQGPLSLVATGRRDHRAGPVKGEHPSTPLRDLSGESPLPAAEVQNSKSADWAQRVEQRRSVHYVPMVIQSALFEILPHIEGALPERLRVPC